MLFCLQGLLIAIEDTSERAADRMVDLFKSLYAANIITPDQMRQVCYPMLEEVASTVRFWLQSCLKGLLCM